VLFLCAVNASCVALVLLNLTKWRHGTPETPVALVLLACYLPLHTFHLLRPEGAARWTLPLQGLLTYLPPHAPGVLWGAFGGLFAGALLVVLRGTPLAWTLYALNACGVFACSWARFDIPESACLTLAGLVIGLVLHGLARLRELSAARAGWYEYAVLSAVRGERLRFARDLHDLLGCSLSAITLKSEVTLRRIGVDDEEARRELAETVALARQALTEVRTVARGYRELSPLAELRAATRVLRTAGIAVTVSGGFSGRLDAAAGTALAAVLREAVANILHHSRARRCRIALGREGGQVWLAVRNDGVGSRTATLPAPAAPRGSGLDNLAARLGALGGRLSADDDGEWFTLRARCPERAPRSTAMSAVPRAERGCESEELRCSGGAG
jgi:two-component system sensor histidine kinase DesK